MLTNLVEKYDYADVLIVPNDSALRSRSEVNLVAEKRTRWGNAVIKGVPIIAANMDTVGTVKMASAMQAHGAFTAMHKHHSQKALVQHFKQFDNTMSSFYTMGTSSPELLILEDIQQATDNGVRMVCIDIANGHSDIILGAIKRLREAYPSMVIMAGNVVTGDRAVKLIEAGADIVKVGIGPGSACTTRRQTGVGYPQLSAVYECAKAVESVGGLICADGGCTVPGDISKALIAGADFVMLGGMLAGHEECDGELIEFEEKLRDEVKTITDYKTHETLFAYADRLYTSVADLPPGAWTRVPLEKPYMVFYGMSSETAMNKHHGGLASYRSSEGRTVHVPYRGKVDATMLDILGGVRSTMTYIGVENMDKIAYSASFVKTRHQLNTVFAK